MASVTKQFGKIAAQLRQLLQPRLVMKVMFSLVSLVMVGRLSGVPSVVVNPPADLNPMTVWSRAHFEVTTLKNQVLDCYEKIRFGLSTTVQVNAENCDLER